MEINFSYLTDDEFFLVGQRFLYFEMTLGMWNGFHYGQVNYQLN